MQTILFLEDDPILAQTMIDYLEDASFEVTHVKDGDQAIDAAYEGSFDLYLFDVNVPKLNGFELLKALREAEDRTPTFFLTALSDLDSLQKGFDVGADDYIKKPFDMDELLVRLRAKLSDKTRMISYHHLSYDPRSRVLTKKGKVVDLGEIQANIFDLLITYAGQTVDKTQFYEVMDHPSDQALRVHMTKLKKILEIEIINVRGVGYRLDLS